MKTTDKISSALDRPACVDAADRILARPLTPSLSPENARHITEVSRGGEGAKRGCFWGVLPGVENPWQQHVDPTGRRPRDAKHFSYGRLVR